MKVSENSSRAITATLLTLTEDTKYKALRVTVGKSIFDFNTGDIILDWINYIGFIGSNFKSLQLKRVEHDFSFHRYLAMNTQYYMAYFRQDGKILPESQVQSLSYPELSLYERYIVDNNINSIKDLSNYYQAHNHASTSERGILY